MRHRKAETVGSVIAELLRDTNLETALLEKHVIEAWPKVIGEKLVPYTKTPTMKNGIMYVKIPSAPLRQEFFMARGEILRRLNEQVGSAVVKQIILLG